MNKENMQKKKFITEERLGRIVPALLSSLTLALVVFVVAPLDIFGSNYAELDFTLANFAFYLIIGAILTVLLFGSLMFFLPHKAYRCIFAFTLATAALFIIQQNFLNFGMNSLPGDKMAGEVPETWQIILDLAVWIFVYAGAFFLAIWVNIKGDKGDVIKTVSFIVSFALLASQITSPIFIVINSNSKFETNILKGSGKKGETIISTERGFNELAQKNNVYYFCIDRFDEEYAEKAYASDSGIFSELTGFTWYQDNVSNYGHTFPAVANMLTQKKYNADLKRAEFLDNAYKGGDTPLDRLNENGYAVNIYTVKYYAFTNAKHLPQYVGNLTTATDESDNRISFLLSAHFAAFSLYRAAPLILKQLFDTGSTSDVNGIVDKKGADRSEEWLGTNNQAETLAKNSFTVGDSEKQFAFIHYDGMHDVIQPSSPFIPSILSRNIGVVNSFVKALKENGLYKDATIIITGDHSRPVSDISAVINNGKGQPRRTALFVKIAGSDEGFAVSEAPTSHEDIWATIFRSENIGFEGSGVAVNLLSEGQSRERIYTWHTYATGSLDEYVYKINGKASNIANWEEIGHIHLNKFLMS
ncbi:MAG: sulfatase-like hydrolase/transferase [Candidatus Borkfalkiaceae bacterium]|nr:sulfatase-like hydrolase/transferase [Christensenellaceae bacterium]